MEKSLHNDSLNKPVEAIFQLCRFGYEDPSDLNKTKEINKILSTWNLYPAFALRIGFEVATRKTSVFMKDLQREIRSEIAIQSGVAPDELSLLLSVSYSREKNEIFKKWLEQNCISGRINPDAAILGLSFLLNEDLGAQDFNLIDKIIDRTEPNISRSTGNISKRGSRNERNKYAKYLRRIIPAFTARQINFSKVAYARDLVEIFKNMVEDVERDFRKVSEEHNQLVNEHKIIQREIGDKDNTIKKLQHERELLERGTDIIKNELTEAEKRSGRLEEYWKSKLKTDLAAQAHQIIKKLTHEIQEARLSLKSNTPNISMALSRIKHMEEYLIELEEKSND
ncbi:MAG: hypothetical protein ACHQQQ_13680 [Bacteroidota bacterium]